MADTRTVVLPILGVLAILAVSLRFWARSIKNVSFQLNDYLILVAVVLVPLWLSRLHVRGLTLTFQAFSSANCGFLVYGEVGQMTKSAQMYQLTCLPAKDR